MRVFLHHKAMLVGLLLTPLAPIEGADDLVSSQQFTVQKDDFWYAALPLSPPKWENGFVLTRDAGPDTFEPRYYVFDRLGKQLVSPAVTFPDSHSVRLWDIAASTDGTVAVDATAWPSVVSYIAWFDRAGKMIHAKQTSPYAALGMCFANDGTLWTVGREYLPDRNSKPEYDLVRRYSRSGRLLGSLVPRHIFPLTPAHPDPGREAYLVSGKDRVGLYTTLGGLWIEMSLSGEILTVIKAPFNQGQPSGLALTSSGAVFLTGPAQRSQTGPPRLFLLDRATGRWLPVVVDGGLFPGGRIMGADGTDLLLLRDTGQPRPPQPIVVRIPTS